MSLLIKNISVIDPENKISGINDILVENKIISKIDKDIPGDFKAESSSSMGNTFDGTDLFICPGFIDLHCHLREPGYTHKEDLKSGGSAAPLYRS